MSTVSRPRRIGALSTVLLAIAAAGCLPETAFAPRHPLSALPASPEAALLAFEKSWDTRDPSLYRLLFTERYRWECGAEDSAGGTYRGTPWLREDELGFFDHLVHGGTAGQPAMTRIAMTLRSSQVFADPRGGDFRTRRAMRATLALDMTDASDGQTILQARALFYFVRADSAAIPPDLADRPGAPDRTRWLIDGWIDETVTDAGAARALPAGQPTLCEFRERYL